MNQFKSVLKEYVIDKERVRENMKIKNNYKLVLAGVLVLLICFGFYYNNPTSYVSLDINPSILLSVNRFDKVVKVEALNDDASKVISDLKLYNTDVTDAVNKIVNEANELGYVKDEEEAILVSTYCDNTEKQDKLQQKIHKNLEDNLNKNGIGSLIIDMTLTNEDALKMNEYGVSEAKILFVKKAIEQNPELKLEDLIYLPTREIAKYIDGYEDVNNGNQNNQGNGDNNQNGNNQGNGNQYGNHGNNSNK